MLRSSQLRHYGVVIACLLFGSCADLGSADPGESTSTPATDALVSVTDGEDVFQADVSDDTEDINTASDTVMTSDAGARRRTEVTTSDDISDVASPSDSAVELDTLVFDTSGQDVGTPSPDDVADELDTSSGADSGAGDVPDPGPCDDDNVCTDDYLDETNGTCVNTYVYGICCTADPMCDDGDPCTEDRCVDELCTHKDSCCEDDAECGETSECATPMCVVADSLMGTTKCTLLPTEVDGCCNTLMYFAGFDDGSLGGISVENAFADVGWQLTENTQANSPPGALWYGSLLTGDYDNGTFNSGLATLPTITLPAGVDSAMELDLYLDVEPGFTFDRLEIQLTDIETGQTTVLWNKSQAFLYSGWFTLTLQLQAFGGKSVALSILFDTFDSQDNSGQGVFVDNIRITSTCTPTICGQDSDCDDGHAFTVDECSFPAGQVTGSCVHYPNTPYCTTYQDCDDGEPCTFNACVNQECYFAQNLSCCLSDVDCNDNNPCTVDDCVGVTSTSGGSCNNLFLQGCCQSDFQCNDGDPCTTDVCNLSSNTCAAVPIESCCATPDDCEDDEPCTEDLCVSGTCEYKGICCGDDADCDDGESLCTVETCSSGLCTASFTNAPQCCTVTQLFTQFASGSWGPFTQTEDENPFDGVGWFAIPYEGISSGGALKYGPLGTGTYDTGAPHSGSATTYVVSLSSAQIHEVSFWVKLDNEYSNGDGSILWDRLRLEAIREDNGDTTLLWDSAWGEPQWWEETNDIPTGSVWTFVDALDVSSLKGRSISLRFSFDTVDADANAYGGALIDDVLLFSTCE